MPFTPAHVAAVLSFRKRAFFSFTGLVIGSMVPDYEYFLRMTLYGHYGHTLRGIWLFDLPVGVFLYVLYHAVVHRQLLAHMPPFLYRRFACAAHFKWKSYFLSRFPVILLSVFIGTMTHFVWDGFTHDEEYYLARYLHVLLLPVHIMGYTIPWHILLQGLSSVAGLFILWVYIMRLPATGGNPEQGSRAIRRFWLIVLLLSIFIGIARWLMGMPDEKLIGQLIVVSISSFQLALIIVCGVLQLRQQSAPAA
ncbi:MAG: DUF4184 family protein [Williamsia sp.]|nr:DUF4184 family protein [Williamsia sp.]